MLKMKGFTQQRFKFKSKFIKKGKKKKKIRGNSIFKLQSPFLLHAEFC